MTDWDDWGDESPEEYEAAQRLAEDPPDWYLEEESARQHGRHCAEEHGGVECDCDPWPPPPPCRLLWRLPRWTREGWRAGTPGGCETYLCRTPLRAWRAHQFNHQSPF